LKATCNQIFGVGGFGEPEPQNFFFFFFFFLKKLKIKNPWQPIWKLRLHKK